MARLSIRLVGASSKAMSGTKCRHFFHRNFEHEETKTFSESQKHLLERKDIVTWGVVISNDRL
ncbi:uncharacterized protein G2W53_026332 [Senna tora]|uniref:Uncharacterized protein n=1 Tax=Senna tora TaxID=362788 RepID=A0A834TGQ1_9FABA|nr:uncharacterized protein G2W53_026332 [Senna tora]